MKILITESQLKTLLSEEKYPPTKKKKKKVSDGNSDEYASDIELEEVVVTYDRKSGELSVKNRDWQYVGSKSKRRRKMSYWIAKGIDIGGMKNRINSFAKSYSNYMLDNINMNVGPVITSGYRGPKRQVNAIWDQWVGDKNYLNIYRSEFGKPIEKIFKDNEGKPNKAKRLATDFLKDKEKGGKYMSNHQQKGAIDISLFNDGWKNDLILKFLKKSKSDGIISSFIDERKKTSPHFHIKLA